MKQWIKEHSLALVLFALFFLFLFGLSIAGLQHENSKLEEHGQPQVTYSEYVVSSTFLEAVFENWESEFLAVGSLLVLSVYLRQRKSPEPKPIGEPNKKTTRRISLSHRTKTLYTFNK